MVLAVFADVAVVALLATRPGAVRVTSIGLVMLPFGMVLAFDGPVTTPLMVTTPPVMGLVVARLGIVTRPVLLVMPIGVPRMAFVSDMFLMKKLLPVLLPSFGSTPTSPISHLLLPAAVLNVSK